MRLVLSDYGFSMELVKREGQVAIVKRWRHEPAHYHFEVVRLRFFKGGKLPSGKIVPAGERYPSGSSWGIDGFTYLQNDKNGVERRFKKLIRACKGVQTARSDPQVIAQQRTLKQSGLNRKVS